MTFGNIPSSISEALCDRTFLEYYCCVMECELFRNFRRFDFSRCLTFLRLVIKCAIFRNFAVWLFAMSHFLRLLCKVDLRGVPTFWDFLCTSGLRDVPTFWDFLCTSGLRDVPTFFETFVQGWFTRKKYETALFPSSSTTGHCLNFLDHLLIFALRWCIFEIFA